jgi:Flp pilus assembly protein TadD
MRKMVILQIGLAVVAFAITAWVFFKERPQAQLRQELKEVQQKNAQLQKMAQTVPVPYDRKQSRVYLREGRTLFHQQKYDEAIAMYEKALQSFPDDPYGWSLKGYALFRVGRIPESIEANQKAVELDPGDPLNYIDLAKSYCAAQRFNDAERVLLNDPPPDIASHVIGYVGSDGEIRRVCKPILGRLSNPAPPSPDRD